jgi:Fe-S-cluster containining protein
MKRQPPPTTAEAIAAVQATYEELAARPIERDCVRRTECCHFRLTGRTPYLTKGEALVAAAALRATGRRELPARIDGACPLLARDGRCLIYAGRPFGCRTHFCAAAGGPYARREVSDLIHRLEDLDARLGGDGARPLPAAVQAALR